MSSGAEPPAGTLVEPKHDGFSYDVHFTQLVENG